MDYFFITGSSKGLGKALTELLLTDKNNFVYGISRTNNINHEQFQHLKIDLADLDTVKQFQFPKLKNATSITLINNAGIVGDIKYLGNLDCDKIISTYNLNLITPTLLTNQLLKAYNNGVKKLVLNISSGAGRNPIDGWSVYCATKAGLDMLSLVFKEEINNKSLNVTVLSLAPGIIDTSMQEVIRKADEANFSNIERFIEYKKNGDLADPTSTAKLIAKFISDKTLQEKTICSVRDIS
ncbi:MAG: SDR family NAD(P)-dependent oxidoreductase [Flavobacteriales bacterium]|nr:SDR family NAD(P)-dependent oxidoreductase [Flavobacteriales bacterium]MCW8913148.1 SDR family NAD(P)-dependent oxidoreductase [Flavobacteriales bacterium]MCW8937041.1 SDR family NAD(P)-dependent oxidoreductase [Flavobacteriales bacterium]MCW8941403.1 SDR family NAD(P)-dependent oxidoreductase [Flavobacteriales bacterium]MCW8967417.1 SDR family NAD(P)-dependent oxidoreductase [Flavobacteriales bacterium]